MNKLLKVRVLLPILLLVYVLLGGIVVPQVDRSIGHLILLILSVASIALTMYGFYRYDTYYREASSQRTMFISASVVVVALAALAVYHGVAIVAGFTSLWEMYGGELTLVILAFSSWLIYENNKPDKA